MNKSQKPIFDKLSSFLAGFLPTRSKNSRQINDNSHYTPIPIKPRPTPLANDPVARFRSLSSTRNIASTPLQDFVETQVHAQAGSRSAPPTPIFTMPEEPSQTPVNTGRPSRFGRSAPVINWPEFKFTLPKIDASKILPAFWTIASVLSFAVNIILILALLTIGRELFTLKSMIGDQLLGGLYENFIAMDQAHIQTQIGVTSTVPVTFNLPISQDTIVVLTQNTPINGANVRISTGGLTINSPANIILPAGTNLPVHLELSVPVTTTIPVQLQVPVDIPLAQTDLHKPFIGLQQVVAPFYNMFQPQVKAPQDIKACGPLSFLCSIYFK